MIKKIRNYTCKDLNCIDCPLRMLRCYGFHSYDKKIGQVWKEYIAERTALHSPDKAFISFMEGQLSKEKEIKQKK